MDQNPGEALAWMDHEKTEPVNSFLTEIEFRTSVWVLDLEPGSAGITNRIL